MTRTVYYYRLKERSIIIDHYAIQNRNSVNREKTIGGDIMADRKLCDSEYRFMILVWESAPIRSGELVRLANERFGWKKSTTYTVIRKLSGRGFLENADSVVRPLVTQDECQAAETDYFVDRTFGGSLPKFLAAFLGDKKISAEEAEELKRMIDAHRKK